MPLVLLNAGDDELGHVFRPKKLHPAGQVLLGQGRFVEGAGQPHTLGAEIAFDDKHVFGHCLLRLCSKLDI